MDLPFIEPEIREYSRKEKKEEKPASYIRKEFEVSDPINKATIVLTALGVYKAFINGKELDRQYLLPGFTNYHKRLQYQEYNITNFLKPGKNVIAVILADGWYRGAIGIFNTRNFYGEKIKLAAKLTIQSKKQTQIIQTDSSWKATQSGPLAKSDLKTLEVYDARKEMKDWKKPGFDDSNWHNCKDSVYSGNLISHEGEKILEHESFSPKVIQAPNDEMILDFGQNLSGHVAFKVNGKKGHQVELVMGETLDENGNFTQKNLDPQGGKSGKLGQKLIYILKDGTQKYRSQFLVSGFRYVKVVNWPEEIKPTNFRSIAIYSDLPKLGQFKCSNPKINQLVSNIKWAQKSNFLDIPTDCPTRERTGWTGDINVFCQSADYLTDTRKFLNKWFGDFISLQTDKGSLPYVVPEGIKTKIPYSSAGWSDALVNIPVVQYQFFGDISTIKKVYPTAQKYVGFLKKRASHKHSLTIHKKQRSKYIIDTGFQWGEWLEPGHVMSHDLAKGAFHPDAEVATAWFYYSVKRLAQMSSLLGKGKEYDTYINLASKIKTAYRKAFLNHGKVNSKRQAPYIRPVYMGLVNKNEAQHNISVLNQKCIENGYKIGTGFLTTYKLLPILCDYGYTQTAYKILENEKCPGWLYEVNKGATTTWENWLGIDSNNVPRDSQNHYASGSVIAWLFAYCAGIKAKKPGFSQVQIKPYLGGGLKWIEASYKSIKGLIKVKWQLQENNFNLEVFIPKGLSTTVVLPDGKTEQISKSRKFICEVNK